MMKIIARDYKNDIYYKDYVHVILGSCQGVALCKRGIDDNHVLIVPLVKDDENWFVPSDSGFSSFWLPEHIKVMQDAQIWMEMNCDKDPPGFGYIFRNKEAL